MTAGSVISDTAEGAGTLIKQGAVNTYNQLKNNVETANSDFQSKNPIDWLKGLGKVAETVAEVTLTVASVLDLDKAYKSGLASHTKAASSSTTSTDDSDPASTTPSGSSKVNIPDGVTAQDIRSTFPQMPAFFRPAVQARSPTFSVYDPEGPSDDLLNANGTYVPTNGLLPVSEFNPEKHRHKHKRDRAVDGQYARSFPSESIGNHVRVYPHENAFPKHRRLNDMAHNAEQFHELAYYDHDPFGYPAFPEPNGNLYDSAQYGSSGANPPYVGWSQVNASAFL